MKKNITLIICLLCFGQVLMAQELLKEFRDNNNLYGLKDKNGNVVVEPKYTDINSKYALNNNGFMITDLNNQKGLIDGRTGKEIIPPKYDYINPSFSSSIVEVKLNEKFGAVDLKTGKEVVPLIYSDGVTYMYDGLAVIWSNKKCGLFDITNGKEIIAPNKYYRLDYFYNGVAIATSATYKEGLINVKTGEEIVAPKYDDIWKPEDTTLVKLNGKYGLIEWKTGKEIVAPKYEEPIEKFNSDGFANVLLDTKDGLRYGFINRQGEEVLPCVYNRKIEQLSKNGLYKTNKDDEYGLVTVKGQVKEIIPPKYKKIEYYNDNLIVVDSGGYFKDWSSIINIEGEEIIPPRKYITITILDKQLGLVKGELIETKKWGIIDVTNKREILPFNYDEINEFDTNGTVMIKLNGKWGAANKEGKEIAPPKYDEVSKFKNGLAEVKISDKYGFINTQWKEVTPVKYDEIVDLFDTDGIAMVKLNDKWGIVNKEGKEALPAKYDNVYQFKNGLAKVEISNKYGLINTQGEEVLPVQYDIINAFDANGLAKVRESNKFGLINTKGKLIVPSQYDFIGGLLPGTDVFFVAQYGKKGYMDKFGNEIALEKYMINTDFDFLFKYQCNAGSRFSFLTGRKVSVSGSVMTLTDTYNGETQSTVVRLPIASASKSISNGVKYWTYDFYQNENNYKSAIVEFHPVIAGLMYSITLVSDKDLIYCNDTQAAAGLK